jgi:hypothetical protein
VFQRKFHAGFDENQNWFLENHKSATRDSIIERSEIQALLRRHKTTSAASTVLPSQIPYEK